MELATATAVTIVLDLYLASGSRPLWWSTEPVSPEPLQSSRNFVPARDRSRSRDAEPSDASGSE